MPDNEKTETSVGTAAMNAHQFTYDGQTFETKAAQNGDMYEVRVFHAGAPANRVVYSVSFNTRFDLNLAGMDAIGQLRTMAEEDFKRWNDWAKIQKKRRENA